MNATSTAELDRFVAAYEGARSNGTAPIDEFLPQPDHPLYPAVLCELVRVEMEFDRAAGRGRSLDEYRDRFPGLFGDAAAVTGLAFEEYRLRCRAGEPVTREEYARRYGLDTTDWPVPPDHTAPSEGIEPTRVLPVQELFAGGGTDDGDFLRELMQSNPAEAESVGNAITQFPAAGSVVAGFRLSAELGRGAIGRAYLATQPDLAGRRVVVKLSPDAFYREETGALSQLQHTNIVPIYSVHHPRPFVAVCMPYLGSVTLDRLIARLRHDEGLPATGESLVSTFRTLAQNRPTVPDDATLSPQAGSGAPDLRATPAPLAYLAGLGFVEARLWIAEQLAAGLAHAHERGVLHRDLKPANVLMTDDGVPMLIDFNLARRADPSSRACVARAGGTLPYMAPEYMDGMTRGTAVSTPRADVYALGVLLYELLTARFPFPHRRGATYSVLPAMREDRRTPPPPPSRHNRLVTPAVDAIVGRCLDPNPDRRYASAADLREDLRRQLDDRPLKHAPDRSPGERLRKWARRHPRLSSGTTVGMIAGVLLVGLLGLLVVGRERERDLEARAALDDLRRDMRTIPALLATPDVEPEQLREGIRLCEANAARFGVLDPGSWGENRFYSRLPAGGQDTFRREMGELLWFWARASVWPPTGADPGFALELNRLAESCYPPGAVPTVVWRQRAELLVRTGEPGRGVEFEALGSRAPRTAREAYLDLCDRAADGRWRDTLPALTESTRRGGTSPAEWLLLGHCHLHLKQIPEAALCYQMATSLMPDSPWPWFYQGAARLDGGSYDAAEGCFDRALSVRPGWAAALLNRALARLKGGNPAGAIDDLNRALRTGNAPTRAYFVLAQAHARAGNPDAASRAREQGLAVTPADEQSWIARGVARLPNQPRVALADFEAAIRLNPRSGVGLRNKAHVLSEYLGRPEEAVAVLDAAVGHHPDDLLCRGGRGVLLARLGRRDEAHADAEAVLGVTEDSFMRYQVAGIYALTSASHPGDRVDAFRLLASSFRTDREWVSLAQRDPDLAHIRDTEEFRRLVANAAALHSVQASKP